VIPPKVNNYEIKRVNILDNRKSSNFHVNTLLELEIILKLIMTMNTLMICPMNLKLLIQLCRFAVDIILMRVSMLWILIYPQNIHTYLEPAQKLENGIM